MVYSLSLFPLITFSILNSFQCLTSSILFHVMSYNFFNVKITYNFFSSWYSILYFFDNSDFLIQIWCVDVLFLYFDIFTWSLALNLWSSPFFLISYSIFYTWFNVGRLHSDCSLIFVVIFANYFIKLINVQFFDTAVIYF